MSLEGAAAGLPAGRDAGADLPRDAPRRPHPRNLAKNPDAGLIVRNVDAGVGREVLVELLWQAGPVERFQFLESPSDDSPVRTALCEFAEACSVEYGYRLLYGVRLQGRPLLLEPCIPFDSDQGAGLFVQRLPPAATEADLYELFFAYGFVTDLRVVRDEQEAPMYAFVNFARCEESDRALAAVAREGTCLAISLSNKARSARESSAPPRGRLSADPGARGCALGMNPV